MEKIMYVPKGKIISLNSLYCENVIVRGTLIVADNLVAKHIRSVNGHICAHSISAKSLVGFSVDAHSIVVDKLIAEQVDAVEIHAIQSMAVSSFAKADLVTAGKVTLVDSDIGTLQSNDVTYLAVEPRGLLGTLFASFMRSVWFWFNGEYLIEELDSDDEFDEESELKAYDEADDEMQENDTLSEDEEFLRIKEAYINAKETGYTVQLIPNETQTESNEVVPVMPDFQFAVTTDENVA